jgi:hypothetical protein
MEGNGEAGTLMEKRVDLVQAEGVKFRVVGHWRVASREAGMWLVLSICTWRYKVCDA